MGSGALRSRSAQPVLQTHWWRPGSLTGGLRKPFRKCVYKNSLMFSKETVGRNKDAKSFILLRRNGTFGKKLSFHVDGSTLFRKGHRSPRCTSGLGEAFRQGGQKKKVFRRRGVQQKKLPTICGPRLLNWPPAPRRQANFKSECFTQVKNMF